MFLVRHPAIFLEGCKCSAHPQEKSRSTLSNYRPISLLMILSKVMETNVNRSVTNFLERNSILSPCQFGFRGGLSTADLLTKLHHEWSKSLASGGAVHVLAIDIAGAFDKVSHSGVLHKAKCYGISGPLLTWLRSYLENRQIKAVVGGQSSTPHNIRAGVPQGSILGPTLFLLYVNDCQDILPPGIGLGTYTDDTTLYQSISSTTDIPDASEGLQQATGAISHWDSTWRIAFEPAKSQALQIDHHQPRWGLPAIRFNGFDVPAADQIKLLGVVFDRQLRFTAHIRSTALRANSRLHLQQKCAPLLSSHGRATVNKASVRPILEYCPLV